jgi:hypothetical protein
VNISQVLQTDGFGLGSLFRRPEKNLPGADGLLLAHCQPSYCGLSLANTREVLECFKIRTADRPRAAEPLKRLELRVRYARAQPPTR